MKKEIYPIRFEVRLDDMHVDILKKMAKKYHKTMSEVIRNSIMESWEKV